MVLSALKALPNVDLTAIVTVADSGGSTGRLRDEFGFLPVGDLRQALAALASPGTGRYLASRDIKNQRSLPRRQAGKIKNRLIGGSWIQELLLYRFSKGNGLEGHNLGNLILTALQDMTGSTAQALEVASKIFRLQGHIYPITTQNIQLVIEYQDGTVEIGEHVLDDSVKHAGDKILSLKTSPQAIIYEKAKAAIEKASVVIIGPGDLYGSIMPNLIVNGAPTAFQRSGAKLVFMMNLMTRYTQTHNMTAGDHLAVIEKQIGRKFDAVIINNEVIPPKILTAYREQHEYPVLDDLNGNQGRKIIRAHLLKPALAEQKKADAIHRSYLRHDPIKLSKVLKKIIYES